jgi:hypothetical protein
MNKTFIVNFQDWKCFTEIKRYNKPKNICIILHDSVDGMRVANATVNFDDTDLPEDEVLVKNYSENTGMFTALAKAGIVEAAPVSTTKGGYIVQAKLTAKYLESEKKFFEKIPAKKVKHKTDELFDGTKI